MQTSQDTIAAIATAPGQAGIAVVRVSGPDSLAIADALFCGTPPPPSQRPDRCFLYGHVRYPAEEQTADLDEVILLIYRAPHSYTREDVVEIQGHGGHTCARRILRAVLQAGARPAEPGEFTKRAFLNGRIDLLQAEAVADLIRARSERAAAAAIEQLEGRLSSEIGNIYDDLLQVAGDVEASLDFTEDELPGATMPMLLARVDAGIEKLDTLLATWEEGRLLREGAKVAICGRPNVGKSTLLNRWVGTERAIVTDTPGTTRDTIEEQVVLNGIPLRLIDTAGLRESECHIEQQGVKRTQTVMDQADVIVYMLDASKPLGPEEVAALDNLRSDRVIAVLNKTDLPERTRAEQVPVKSVVSCSLLNGIGLQQLFLAVKQQLAPPATDTAHPSISERHRQYVQSALTVLNTSRACLATQEQDQVVPAAALLREGLESLGTLTGRTYTTDILDNIFSRFCIGK